MQLHSKGLAGRCPAIWCMLCLSCQQDCNEETYDLQLDNFAVQLHGPDFLHMGMTRSIREEQLSNNYVEDMSEAEATYKVDANCRDVALCVCVILHNRGRECHPLCQRRKL